MKRKLQILAIFTVVLFSCSKEETPETGNCSNMINDGHFDSSKSLDHWNVLEAHAVSLDESTVYEGASSLHMEGDSTEYYDTNLEYLTGVPVVSDIQYEFSCAVKILHSGKYGNAMYAFSIRQGGESLMYDGFYFHHEHVDVDWKVRKFYFTALDNTPIKLYIRTSAQHVWLDNIGLREAACL